MSGFYVKGRALYEAAAEVLADHPQDGENHTEEGRPNG